MIITPITNGIVIDHIHAGRGMTLYETLHLADLDCSTAIILNAPSEKLGRKDIIKVDTLIDIDLDVLGYIDPNITVNIIRNGVLDQKKHLSLPKRVVNVIQCKNPRCITSVERAIPQIFTLTDEATGTYRCFYCEQKAK